MASREILAGENPTIYFLLRATTDGQPLINKAYGDFTVYYSAIKTDGSGAGPTQVSLTGAGTLNAYNSGTLIKVDDTNQPGLYQLCLPTAVSTAGYREVRVGIRCTGAFTLAETVIVKQFNSQSATPNVSVAGFNKTTLDAGADGDKNFSDFINNSASLGGAAVRNDDVPRVNNLGDIFANAAAIKLKTDLLNAGGTANTIKADLYGVFGTTLTQATGAGKLAGSLSKLLDVATPVFTCASVNSTGDAYSMADTTNQAVSDVYTTVLQIPSLGMWVSGTDMEVSLKSFRVVGTSTLASLSVTGAATVGDGIVVNCSTASKAGIQVTGGSGNSHGILANGTGTGSALTAAAGGSGGNGIYAAGNGSGHGILAYGGTGTISSGIVATSGATMSPSGLYVDKGVVLVEAVTVGGVTTFNGNVILTDTTTPGGLGKNIADLLARITSTLFTGITSLAQWLGALVGKQVPNSTALAEMRATGAGSGTFEPDTDSLEALQVELGSGLLAMTDTFTEIKGATFDTATDSLEATSNNVGSLLTRIPAALFSGITSLAKWLGLLGGKVADTTARDEIRTTTGQITFDNTTDSGEAVRDLVAAGTGGGATNNVVIHNTEVKVK